MTHEQTIQLLKRQIQTLPPALLRAWLCAYADNLEQAEARALYLALSTEEVGP